MTSNKELDAVDEVLDRMTEPMLAKAALLFIPKMLRVVDSAEQIAEAGMATDKALLRLRIELTDLHDAMTRNEYVSDIKH